MAVIITTRRNFTKRIGTIMSVILSLASIFCDNRWYSLGFSERYVNRIMKYNIKIALITLQFLQIAADANKKFFNGSRC